MRRATVVTARGFTLVECLIACTLATLLLTLAVPAFRGHELRAGRLDAVEALTRVQLAQEKFRSAHGLYAGDLGGLLGTNARSPQGRYAIAVAPSGPLSYVATATAQGAQARDPGCERLTLAVNEGFATLGPHAGCWLR